MVGKILLQSIFKHTGGSEAHVDVDQDAISKPLQPKAPGLNIRVHIGKLFSLFLIQNICCGYSKEPFH